MDVGKYLSRIGYVGPVESTFEVLRSVHRRHLLSVPFENLTIHSGGRVQREPSLLFEKIVNRRRGGFCCENNGLFYWLLVQMGFQVTRLSGQVRYPDGLYGPPFDHMILMVTLDGRRWLCDVGFGAPGIFFPLSLDTSDPQEQGHRVYRVREDSGMHFLEWQGEGSTAKTQEWTSLYKFTFEPRAAGDFEQMCLHHQTSEYSLFFCKSLCTMAKPHGRSTYIGFKLTNTTYPTGTEGVTETTRELKADEITDILAEEFGIVLDSPLIPKDEPVTPLDVVY
ncbi:arylamine N-acetyltransferase, pineal gland isozyme NAT-3-like [Synchiropus splendidus]|uniref:arylamine N-acetyltransferase, pineal gland isozyme NAT-3-like n=1 Tax=Synchiropus splendidus TaxID=270530 RepID=UPI00237DF89B|nr:arylamine N-acetyltransferase, pineal gland isozyme NAT-3-like [Synchiropus splendidus]